MDFLFPFLRFFLLCYKVEGKKSKYGLPSSIIGRAISEASGWAKVKLVVCPLVCLSVYERDNLRTPRDTALRFKT